MYLQKTLTPSPDSDRALATRSVFCQNRFSIKGHYLSRSMLPVKGAPETIQTKKKEVKQTVKEKSTIMGRPS